MTHLRLAVALFVACFCTCLTAAAQSRLDMTVAGLKLGDRGSGRALLSEYNARMVDGMATYYFYNKNGDTVMKVTALSPEDRFFVTSIEVYAVDQKYRSRHYQLDKIARFTTESGIFIGWYQTKKGITATLMMGVPYPLGVTSIEPKTVIGRYGEPTIRRKEGSFEILDYRAADAPLSGDEPGKYVLAAHFEFHDGLQRFSITLVHNAIP